MVEFARMNKQELLVETEKTVSIWMCRCHLVGGLCGCGLYRVCLLVFGLVGMCCGGGGSPYALNPDHLSSPV